MSIELVNPTQRKYKVLRTKDLKPGVLYKSSDEDGNLSSYDTIYTKTLGGKVLFFEEGRLNVDESTEGDYFVEAPQGTKITIKN